jgi:LAO/AO transport system kinase
VQVTELVAGVKAGNKRAIGRLITLLESEDRRAAEALHALHPDTGRAHVIGVTGSPGTGKSTLTDRLIGHYRDAGQRVGVVAIDPSSPFTGGAILGDRIRMQQRSTDTGVFIRSMASRGALGGLSAHAADAVKVLDAAGCDVVLVETVGVGQAEVEVVRLADTVLVILVPNLGDHVQAFKAGVMEIADIFVVNKADLAGADRVHADLEGSLSLGHPDADDFWWPPIVRTIGEKGDGLDELTAAIAKHREWSQRSGTWDERRAHRLWEQVRALLAKRLATFAFGPDGAPTARFADDFTAARRGDITPSDVVDRILAAYAKS